MTGTETDLVLREAVASGLELGIAMAIGAAETAAKMTPIFQSGATAQQALNAYAAALKMSGELAAAQIRAGQFTTETHTPAEEN